MPYCVNACDIYSLHDGLMASFGLFQQKTLPVWGEGLAAKQQRKRRPKPACISRARHLMPAQLYVDPISATSRAIAIFTR